MSEQNLSVEDNVGMSERNVVNYAKMNVPSENQSHERVVACWMHVPKGATLGGTANRVLIRGWNDSVAENWSQDDQRLLNREYWEQGCAAFAAEPETLFPIDVALWHPLALASSGFRITFFDESHPIGRHLDRVLYERLNMNGVVAIYQGRTSGLDAENNDLLIPDAEGWFLHYKIDGKYSLSDWRALSARGDNVGCQEILLSLSRMAAKSFN